DPVLKDRNGRIAQREQLFATIQSVFATQPWAYWQERMRAAQIPCGEVRTVGEAIRSPEAQARKLVTRIPHPTLGEVPNIASPILAKWIMKPTYAAVASSGTSSLSTLRAYSVKM